MRRRRRRPNLPFADNDTQTPPPRFQTKQHANGNPNEQDFDAALDLVPNHAGAALRKGRALAALGRPEEARAAWRAAQRAADAAADVDALAALAEALGPGGDGGAGGGGAATAGAASPAGGAAGPSSSAPAPAQPPPPAAAAAAAAAAPPAAAGGGAVHRVHASSSSSSAAAAGRGADAAAAAAATAAASGAAKSQETAAAAAAAASAPARTAATTTTATTAAAAGSPPRPPRQTQPRPHPHHPLMAPDPAAVNIAVMQINAGRIDEAARLLDAVLAARPRELAALVARGTARALRGDLAGAVSDFSSAVEVEPAYADAWRRRAQARAAVGDALGAVEDYERCAELLCELRAEVRAAAAGGGGRAGGGRQVGRRRAVAGEGQGARGSGSGSGDYEYDEAEEEGRGLGLAGGPRRGSGGGSGSGSGGGGSGGGGGRPARRGPVADRDRHGGGGGGSFGGDDVDEDEDDEEDDVRRAAAAGAPDPLSAQVAECHTERGLLLQRARDYQRAAGAFARAAEAAPRSPGAWNSLGLCLTSIGELRGGAEAYRRAVALSPGMREAWANLAQCLKEWGRVAEADRAFAAVERLDVALCRGGCGGGGAVAAAAAEEEVGEAEEQGEQQQQGRGGGGACAVAVVPRPFLRGGGTSASTASRQRHHPPSIAPWRLHAHMRQLLGDHDGAAATLDRALALAHPGDPAVLEALFLRAACHHARGRVREAVRDYDGCLVWAPPPPPPAGGAPSNGGGGKGASAAAAAASSPPAGPHPPAHLSEDALACRNLAFYQRELAIYLFCRRLASRADAFSLDAEAPPLLKESWCKKGPVTPSLAATYTTQACPLPESRGGPCLPPPLPAGEAGREAACLARAADAAGGLLQNRHRGFLANSRQRRAAGLAALELAQALRRAAAARRGDSAPLTAPDAGSSAARHNPYKAGAWAADVEADEAAAAQAAEARAARAARAAAQAAGASSSPVRLSSPSSSSPGGSPTAAAAAAATTSRRHCRHPYGWRDALDGLARWRQLCEPGDPSLWVDRLTRREFGCGFGSHTPMHSGQTACVRYAMNRGRALERLRAAALEAADADAAAAAAAAAGAQPGWPADAVTAAAAAEAAGGRPGPAVAATVAAAGAAARPGRAPAAADGPGVWDASNRRVPLGSAGARAALASAGTLGEMYAALGGRDAWVVLPLASRRGGGGRESGSGGGESGGNGGESKGASAGAAAPAPADAPLVPLEGTRLTLVRAPGQPDGFEFSIRTPVTPPRWEAFDAELGEAWGRLVDALAAVGRTGGRRQGEEEGASEAAAANGGGGGGGRSGGDGEDGQAGGPLYAVARAALTCAFYWYNFMPLARGTAACGHAFVIGAMWAAAAELEERGAGAAGAAADGAAAAAAAAGKSAAPDAASAANPALSPAVRGLPTSLLGPIPPDVQMDWEAILSPDPEAFVARVEGWLLLPSPAPARPPPSRRRASLGALREQLSRQYAEPGGGGDGAYGASGGPRGRAEAVVAAAEAEGERLARAAAAEGGGAGAALPAAPPPSQPPSQPPPPPPPRSPPLPEVSEALGTIGMRVAALNLPVPVPADLIGQ